MARLDRMYRQGKAVDATFLPYEMLFLRIRREQIAADGKRVEPRTLNPYLSSPAFSVNREKYSEPRDVLIPSCGSTAADYDAFGVGEFPVAIATASGTQSHPVCVVHEPCDDNYAHSEVRSYQGSTFDPDTKPPKAARNALRAAIFKHARVRVQPPG